MVAGLTPARRGNCGICYNTLEDAKTMDFKNLLPELLNLKGTT